MKILFCAYDKPGHIATGPNAWIQRLIPDLRSTYNIDVHTLFIYKGEVKDCPTLSFFESNELPIFTVDREQTHYVEDQVKEILRIIKDHDFKILVTNLVIPALYATSFLKPYDIPVIGVLHSNDAFYRGVIDKFIKGKKENQLTASVSVSNYIQNLATSVESNTLNLVIPCGTPLFIEKDKKDRTNILKIIYAGRLVIEAKQILKVTEAFCNASKSNKDFEFNIYGDGDQEERVREIIEENQASHQVKLHKALPPAQILEAISKHHVFTLMSDYEGMPLSLMEAMACGVVPLCYINKGGIDEIIDHGVNGFILTDRDEDYKEKLNILFKDRILLKQMSKNAITTIEQDYSSEITHKKWAELLDSYKNIKSKPIRIPHNLRLQGELLFYGDNRKPATNEIVKKLIFAYWFKFRMLARPRARLRSFFKNEK